jgi:hypothetical protein
VNLSQINWPAIEQALDQRGFAVTPPLLSTVECAELAGCYEDEALFRSRVVMAQHNFGSGEYKYFGRPLPGVVEGLRRELYPRLAPVAKRWGKWLGDGSDEFPHELAAFLDLCAQHGQTRPTPLLLRYEAGDYNCLHQDLYGDVAFPLQVTILLSRPDEDFRGGEFLLLEQRPRAQSRGQVVRLAQAQAEIFATRHRPVRGTRGWYRAALRHGVSEVTEGQRFTLGVIFHDAR